MKGKIFAQVASYDRYTRSVVVIASTPNPVEAFDGDGKPILEALIGWDLDRFTKNPVACWAHNTYWFPVGKASELEPLPDGGLKMRITLRGPGRSEIVDELAGCLEDDTIRAVSVGFRPGASSKRADGTWERRNNELSEISFVTVPADEDAGTPELNPDAGDESTRAKESTAVLEELDEATQRKRVSDAARELARHRSRGRKRARTDAVQRFDVGGLLGRLRNAKDTSLGGKYVHARISRTGVLSYRMPNGSIRRELRHPDEVFKPESLATLDSVPVIDITDHTKLRSPGDYRSVTRGHVKSFRRDGRFVESELVVQDAGTLDQIDVGERTEISAGYDCKLDMTPGVYEGEPYDCVQRDIVYNHVALCPPNRGRAGPEVGLRLDSNSDSTWGVSNIVEERVMKMIRLDGKDYEVGSEAHLDKLESMHKEALAREVSAVQTKLDAADRSLTDVQAKLVTAEKARDEAQGRLDAADKELTKARAAVEEKDKTFEEKLKEKIADERAALRKQARARGRFERAFRFMFGEDEEEDADEEKQKKLDAMTDRDLMIAVIRKDAADFTGNDADGKPRSDDYISARFDSVLENVKKSKGIDGVTRTVIRETERLDANVGDGVAAARKKRDELAKNAWKVEPAK